MIPKINNRGSSFKGVTAYLIHDKGRAETSERVAWTHTENMHTNEPEKAAKVMAWTDINREQIRADNGGGAAGRKAEKGNIYHRSLSWALSDNPSDEHMLETALSYIKNDGLSEHQGIIIAHNDAEYKHLHIVNNLVHPETGLIHDPGLDKRRGQKWALDYEREHGIHCDQRVENALKREQGENTKYQDQKQDYADKVTRAYYASDNGKAFIHALKEEGLELGKARRGDRNYVIVDDRGDIQKLSRQLQIEEKGKLKTEAIQALLSDINYESIKDASEIVQEIKTRDKEAVSELEQRKREASEAEHAKQQRHNEETAKDRESQQQEYFDRDAYQAEQDDKTHHAALDADKWRRAAEQARENEAKAAAAEFKRQESRQTWAKLQQYQREQIRGAGSFAEELDDIRAADAIKEKEDQRKQEIFEQQDKNIEEGIKRGLIPPPLESYETAPPKIEPPEQQFKSAKEMLEHYERASAKPEPERQTQAPPPLESYEKEAQPPAPQADIEPPAPLESFERAAAPGNDNAQTQESAPAQEQGQSRDSGGYER